MLKDILAQAWEAMISNWRRTAITMLGMAWGIATVVVLLGYGAGFSKAIENIFAQWGTNTIGFFPGRTSQQAGGDKAGVKVRFTLDDVDRVSNNVPGIFHISPVEYENATVQNDLHSYTWEIDGVRPVFQDIFRLDTDTGRFFNGEEEQQRAHVCVIGSEAKTKLFSGGWALGETIRLNGEIFTIVGVIAPKMQEGEDNNRNRIIYIPYSTMSDLKDTQYVDGVWFSYRGDYQLVEKALRETMGAAHHFRPTDHNAMFVANVMTQLSQFRILSIALQVLLSMVGALTLGIAGIGLMNIMLVAVQQRTREIGIEKALGARKGQILIQFMAEALAITGAGGVCGILLAFLISAAVGRIPFYSMIAKNASDADIRLIISPGSILTATVILIVTGLVSGMIPAIRAANMDPVEALRYE
ncbi:MAG: ABC transporter permease [Terracidiphilus sp.]